MGKQDQLRMQTPLQGTLLSVSQSEGDPPASPGPPTLSSALSPQVRLMRPLPQALRLLPLPQVEPSGRRDSVLSADHPPSATAPQQPPAGPATLLLAAFSPGVRASSCPRHLQPQTLRGLSWAVHKAHPAPPHSEPHGVDDAVQISLAPVCSPGPSQHTGTACRWRGRTTREVT